MILNEFLACYSRVLVVTELVVSRTHCIVLIEGNGVTP